MSEQQCDVVVVGLGPGGEALASRLAKAGLDVVAVEAELVGGECPYWGCIPSKMMIRAANALAEARRIDGLAGHAEVTPDLAPVARRIREVATDNWDDTVAVDRLIDAGIRFVRGHGRLAGERTVEVETADGVERIVASRGVVLNTGTTPAVPPIDGLADTPFWTNRDCAAGDDRPRLAHRHRWRRDRARAGPGVRAVRLRRRRAGGGAAHPRSSRSRSRPS